MIGWALGAAAALVTGLVVLHSSTPKPAKKTAPGGKYGEIVLRLWTLTQYTDAAHYTADDQPIPQTTPPATLYNAQSVVDSLFEGYYAQGLRNFAVAAYALTPPDSVNPGGTSNLQAVHRDAGLPNDVGPGSNASPVVTQPTVTTLLPLLAASVFPPLGYTIQQTDKPHFANATYLSGNLTTALAQADTLYNANYQQAGVPIWHDGIVIVDPDGMVIANYRKPGAPPDVLPGYVYQNNPGI